MIILLVFSESFKLVGNFLLCTSTLLVWLNIMSSIYLRVFCFLYSTFIYEILHLGIKKNVLQCESRYYEQFIDPKYQVKKNLNIWSLAMNL